MQMDCNYRTFGQQITLDCPNVPPQPAESDWMGITVHYVAAALVVLIALFILYRLVRSTFFVVKQQSRRVVERVGRYSRTAAPGIHFKIPLVDKIVATRWLRITQLLVEADTKTKDNVFVVAHVAVQYRVIADKAADAYYMLQDVGEQITSFVLDVARATIPAMTLDEVFEHKDKIAEAVRTALTEKMKGYGYEITDVLVPEIDPDEKVKNAMNDIQAQQRLQVAAAAKGEANKIIAIKNAEAEAETKRLQGEGIAKQRTAIANGLKEAVATLALAADAPKNEVLMTVMLTQYLDTMKEIGASSGSKVILLPHSPAGMADILGQIRDAVTAAEQVR